MCEFLLDQKDQTDSDTRVIEDLQADAADIQSNHKTRSLSLNGLEGFMKGLR